MNRGIEEGAVQREAGKGQVGDDKQRSTVVYRRWSKGGYTMWASSGAEKL